ncbi:MAG: LytR/AlgR family response regulator transcription factor [Lachnospiraceae bacterium]
MINIAICDDDKQDTEQLSELIEWYLLQSSDKFHLEKFQSGEQFLDSGFVPDILFLDIIMDQKDGIQVGLEFQNSHEDATIIYTTNLKEKILVALNRLHAFGYLVKPINRDDFFKMLSDAIKKVRNRQKPANDNDIVTFLSQNNTMIKLPAADIYYFEYRDRKVKIVTEDNTYLCRDKIGSIAEKMEKYGFAMSHQAFVVNLCYIDRITAQTLVMKNGDEVYLAQKRASAIRKKLIEAARESG